MPKIDFKNIEDAQDYEPIPEGDYTCSIANVEEASTKNGDEMWKLKLEVIEGDHEGRFLFDNLVFSDAAMKRVKFVCSRLGVDVSGEMNLTPDVLLERVCKVTTTVQEYEDEKGVRKYRNAVPFTGYEKVDLPGVEIKDDLSEESTPF